MEYDGWGVELLDYTRAYPSYQWRIFKGDVIYTGHTLLIDDIFFQDDTLHWGIAISESAFIGNTVTLLDILH